jgi:phosphoribosylglycinamide formyltransferase 1
MTLRIAVLASGGGRTLQNFVDLAAKGELDVEVVVVGVNKSKCGAIGRAEKAGIPYFCRRKKKSETVAQFSEDVFARVREHKADLVCLAGYLTLLEIPADFECKVLNIHPALIPAFAGKGYYGDWVHEAVWKMGVRVTGCTVHFCDNIYDHGPIILQKPVLVHSQDDPSSIGRKVFEAECEAYPQVLRWIAEGRVQVKDGRCIIEGDENL